MLLFLLFGWLSLRSDTRALFQLLFHEPPDSPLACAQIKAQGRLLSHFLFKPCAQETPHFGHQPDNMLILAHAD